MTHDEDDDLHGLVKSDPERAWPRVVAFVREHPEDAAAADLIEDLVYEHDAQFVGRIEAAALEDPIFRSVVDQAHVGGVATDGAEQFHSLQDRLRLGDVSFRIFSTDEPFVAEDPWQSLIHDAKASPAEDAFLTIRAFGLEGRVEFNLAGETLVWGGSLIDLACWLADWNGSRPRRAHFEPLEQANNLTLSFDGETVAFSSMGERVGQLTAAATEEMIDRFLTALAHEIATSAPIVLELPNMSWAVTRALGFEPMSGASEP